MTKIAFEDFFIPYEPIDNLQYGAWGEPRGPSSAGFSTPFGYTGRWGGYTDSRLGKVLNWHRWYGPQAGRWGSRDPVEIYGGYNLYRYVNNSVLGSADPSGLRYLNFRDAYDLVHRNNRSGQSDELVLCIAFRESGFDPDAVSPDSKSTACGFMQMTANTCSDHRLKANYYNMHVPEYNVQQASTYLKIRIDANHGNVDRALKGFGPGSDSYVDKIKKCEECLKKNCSRRECLK